MATREIVTLPDPVLRQKARKVPAVTEDIRYLIDDMVETMRVAPGVGLAAPQVGDSRRVIVIEYAEPPEQEGEPARPPKLFTLVNPEIVRHWSEQVTGVEGCLSIPGYLGEVERHESVTVKALNRHGQPVRIKAAGWLARIFQHEIDHLDGTLFIDRAAEVWKGEEKEIEFDRRRLRRPSAQRWRGPRGPRFGFTPSSPRHATIQPPMLLQHLSLTNVRNFVRLETDIPPGPTLVVGANAQGKTSLLEAVYYLARASSPHAQSDRQLINFLALQEATPFARLVAEFRRADRPQRVEIRLVLEPGLTRRGAAPAPRSAAQRRPPPRQRPGRRAARRALSAAGPARPRRPALRAPSRISIRRWPRRMPSTPRRSPSTARSWPSAMRCSSRSTSRATTRPSSPSGTTNWPSTAPRSSAAGRWRWPSTTAWPPRSTAI